ncbi:MAG: InlB B-repeat-containing protein [Christensenellales bacterium]|jgi:hypothetical protein|nr:InlB B-repeat-containing protein [Clostridia bacterium]HRU84305.1 InlB B-repeat-containing protein [Eubacteriales bacterium]
MKKTVSLLIALTLLLGVVAAACACTAGVNYTVIFFVNGERYYEVKIKAGDRIIFPEEPKIPGYVFEGWFLDDGKWNKKLSKDYAVNEPARTYITVYAKLSVATAPDYSRDDYRILIPEAAVDITAEEALSALSALVAHITANTYSEPANYLLAESKVSGKVVEGDMTYSVEFQNKLYTLTTPGLTGYIIAAGHSNLEAFEVNYLLADRYEKGESAANVLLYSENKNLWKGRISDNTLYEFEERYSSTSNVLRFKSVSADKVPDTFALLQFRTIAELADATAADPEYNIYQMFYFSSMLSYGIFSPQNAQTYSFKKSGGDYFIIVQKENLPKRIIHFTQTALIAYADENVINETDFETHIRRFGPSDTAAVLPDAALFPDRND